MAKRSKKSSNRWAEMRKRAKKAVKENKDKKGGLSTLKLPNGLELFKIEKAGSVLVNLIPYPVVTSTHPEGCEPGDEWYRTKYSVHRNIGAEEKAYVCLKTWGKRCPFCEQYAILKKEYGWDNELTKAMKPSDRELYLVQDPKSGDLRLWDISCHLFGKALDEEIEDADDDAPFPGDPSEDGASLKLRFKEESWQGNKFYTVSKIEFVGRGEAIDEELLEKAAAIDLDALPIEYSYDKLNAIFLEQDTSDDDDGDNGEEDDDEDEKPLKKGVKKSKKRPAPADDDEDDDEDEDEDEAPPPPPKKSKKRPAPVEDEEDDEDDEDEAPPPPKKKPAAKKTRPAPIEEEDEEEDEDEEDEAPPPKKSKRSKAAEPAAKKGKKSKGPKCPYGGTFGEDCDTLDACDECELWDDCSEASEAE